MGLVRLAELRTGVVPVWMDELGQGSQALFDTLGSQDYDNALTVLGAVPVSSTNRCINRGDAVPLPGVGPEQLRAALRLAGAPAGVQVRQ